MGAAVCQTPICAITLMDRTRLWFKSGHGINTREIKRTDTFDHHALIASEKVFVIPDTLADPRFKDSVMVVSDPFIRFYASAQLISDDGYVLGCLAVSDHRPRELTQEQLSMLVDLSKVAMNFAELNRSGTILHQLFSMDRDFHVRLLRASRELGESSQSTDELLLRLIHCLDPKFGWLSARIMNLQTGTIQIMANPELARGVEIPNLWNAAELEETDADKQRGNLPYISSALINPAWFRLVIPISVRKSRLATFEFIFPEGRFSKRVTHDILHLMASNLMVVSELVLGVLSHVVPAGGHRLSVVYSDGLSATLDFSEYLSHRSRSSPLIMKWVSSPISGPLCSPIPGSPRKSSSGMPKKRWAR